MVEKIWKGQLSRYGKDSKEDIGRIVEKIWEGYQKRFEKDSRADM